MGEKAGEGRRERGDGDIHRPVDRACEAQVVRTASNNIDYRWL